MASSILIMFARYPRPGYVKTRLSNSEFSSPPLSTANACHLYESFLDDLIPRFQDHSNFDYVVMLGGANPSQQKQFEKKYQLRPSQLEPMPSQIKNMGSMMEQTFETYFLKGYAQILLIGSDVPHLSLQRINEAYQSLENTPMVIGPDHGGGMYLVGTIKPTGIMQDGIIWSQGVDRSMVLERCQQQDIAVTLLSEEIDIDTTQDLQQWYHYLQSSVSPTVQAPHTFPQVAHWMRSPSLFAII